MTGPDDDLAATTTFILGVIQFGNDILRLSVSTGSETISHAQRLSKEGQELEKEHARLLRGSDGKGHSVETLIWQSGIIISDSLLRIRYLLSLPASISDPSSAAPSVGIPISNDDDGGGRLPGDALEMWSRECMDSLRKGLVGIAVEVEEWMRSNEESNPDLGKIPIEIFTLPPPKPSPNKVLSPSNPISSSTPASQSPLTATSNHDAQQQREEGGEEDPYKVLSIRHHFHDSLSFRSMGDRMEEVEVAWSGSYGWLFEEGVESTIGAAGNVIDGRGDTSAGNSETSISHSKLTAIAATTTTKSIQSIGTQLREWLESGEGIYWISGLPGSGKSTLMSFIYEHRKTRDLLNSWARTPRSTRTSSRKSHSSLGELNIAGFFCWISGSKEQRTQEGLLRSLLYQLLEHRMEMIKDVFGKRWELVYGMTTKERIKAEKEMVWTLEELSEGILKVFSLLGADESVATPSTCLFIDGLDELEGDHLSLIHLLRQITSNSSVKICCSSRPWEVFENAFSSKGSSFASLRLQDLTMGDMKIYARERLGAGTMIEKKNGQGQWDSKEWKSFLDEVTESARGVFLWLTLVVDLLCDSMDAESDSPVTPRMLSERLHTYPQSLDKLFRYALIDKMDQDSRMEMSKIFQLLNAREVVCGFIGDEQAVSSTLTLWQLANAFEVSLEGIDLGNEEPRQIEKQELDDLIGSMRKRIIKSCSSLLDVKLKRRKPKQGKPLPPLTSSDYASGKIVYVHRTIKDFLSQPTIWKEIILQTSSSTTTTSSPFDPHLSHLRGYILQLKRSPRRPTKDRLLMDRWLDIVPPMTHARYASGSNANSSLDQLDQTLDWYWDRKDQDRSLDYWARDAFSSFEARGKKKTPFHDSFLSLAVKFGLIEYVRWKIQSESESGTGTGSPIVYKGGIPLLSFALEYLFHRQQSIYPLSSPDLIQFLLSLDTPPHKNGHGDPNLTYSTLIGPITNTTTPYRVALDSIRQAYRRGWIEAYDLDRRQGTERWLKVLKMLREKVVEGGEDREREREWEPVVMEETMWDQAGTFEVILERVVRRWGSRRVERVVESTKDQLSD